jgi:hypothetical protein
MTLWKFFRTIDDLCFKGGLHCSPEWRMHEPGSYKVLTLALKGYPKRIMLEVHVYAEAPSPNSKFPDSPKSCGAITKIILQKHRTPDLTKEYGGRIVSSDWVVRCVTSLALSARVTLDEIEQKRAEKARLLKDYGEYLDIVHSNLLGVCSEIATTCADLSSNQLVVRQVRVRARTELELYFEPNLKVGIPLTLLSLRVVASPDLVKWSMSSTEQLPEGITVTVESCRVVGVSAVSGVVDKSWIAHACVAASTQAKGMAVNREQQALDRKRLADWRRAAGLPPEMPW